MTSAADERRLPNGPRLGVVCLQLDHYTKTSGDFEPWQTTGLGDSPPGFYDCPATWPVPTSFVVAQGATPPATISRQPEATDGLVAAVRELAGDSDLVVTDCGFFYAARLRRPDDIEGTTILSSLDLLEFAAKITTRPIGVLTISADNVKGLLSDHPTASRLRIVGVGDQPSWHAMTGGDWATSTEWSTETLRRELVDVVARELSSGEFQKIGILILECTVFPQFRQDLRGVTSLPIIDAAGMAKMLLA